MVNRQRPRSERKMGSRLIVNFDVRLGGPTESQLFGGHSTPANSFGNCFGSTG